MSDELVAAIRALAEEVAKLRAVLEAGGPAPRAATAASPVAARATAAVAATSAAASSAPLGDVEQVLAGLFQAALDPDDETGFEAFVRLVHTDRTDAPHSIPSLKEFSWKSLRKNLGRYLARESDPTSFRVARRVPPELGENDRSVKVFLEATARNPVPVTLKRDKAHGDAWRVTDISL